MNEELIYISGCSSILYYSFLFSHFQLPNSNDAASSSTSTLRKQIKAPAATFQSFFSQLCHLILFYTCLFSLFQTTNGNKEIRIDSVFTLLRRNWTKKKVEYKVVKFESEYKQKQRADPRFIEFELEQDI